MWNDVKAAGALLCWAVVWHSVLFLSSFYYNVIEGGEMMLGLLASFLLGPIPIVRWFKRRTGRDFIDPWVMFAFAVAYFCLMGGFLSTFGHWPVGGATLAVKCLVWSTVIQVFVVCLYMSF